MKPVAIRDDIRDRTSRRVDVGIKMDMQEMTKYGSQIRHGTRHSMESAKPTVVLGQWEHLINIPFHKNASGFQSGRTT